MPCQYKRLAQNDHFNSLLSINNALFPSLSFLPNSFLICKCRAFGGPWPRWRRGAWGPRLAWSCPRGRTPASSGSGRTAGGGRRRRTCGISGRERISDLNASQGRRKLSGFHFFFWELRQLKLEATRIYSYLVFKSLPVVVCSCPWHISLLSCSRPREVSHRCNISSESAGSFWKKM